MILICFVIAFFFVRLISKTCSLTIRPVYDETAVDLVQNHWCDQVNNRNFLSITFLYQHFLNRYLRSAVTSNHNSILNLFAGSSYEITHLKVAYPITFVIHLACVIKLFEFIRTCTLPGLQLITSRSSNRRQQLFHDEWTEFFCSFYLFRTPMSIGMEKKANAQYHSEV